MKQHAFIPQFNNKLLCTFCKRDEIAHGDDAECESCGKKADCEIQGRIDDPRALLLCSECLALEERANDVSIVAAQVSPYNDSNSPFAALAVSNNLPEVSEEIPSIIERSRMIDAGMTYEKFFNSETISIAALKQAVDNESIGTQEKQNKLHSLVLERIMSYRPEIVEHQDKVHELVVKQQAGIRFLRDLGNEVRAEVREKLKAADATYTPAAAIKIPKITKPRTNEVMNALVIETFAMMNNMTFDEAKERLEKK